MANFSPILNEFKTAIGRKSYEAAQQEIQILTGTLSADDVSLRVENQAIV